MDKKFFQEVPELVLDFTKSLQKDVKFKFLPATSGVTKYGELLNLGFSCYALKIFYMTGEFKNLNSKDLNSWTSYIKSFQNIDIPNLEGYFIDQEYLNYYQKTLSTETLTSIIKKSLNLLPTKNYDTKHVKKLNGINAETKQALATLKEVDFTEDIQFNLKYKNFEEIKQYLDSLDWSRPWSAGAQFSSFCVYSNILNLQYEENLIKYVNKIVNLDTGSYYLQKPSKPREVINGAMKIITGLDWIDEEIHYPKKLIDYCLSNKPILEGCDVVDFIYVLYKCSKQNNYRKNEINNLFIELLNNIMFLYVKKDNAFSYFRGKSQTHYYGVPITKGNNSADIHGSLLCLWGILMILDNLDLINEKHRIIKP